METYTFNAYPDHLNTAHVALFHNLKNAAALRAQIRAAATSPDEADRDAVNFAFVEPRLITSRLHLQTAIAQASLAAAQGNLRTKTVHSEILWALNPTNNITEALRRYGNSDTSTTLLVVRVGGMDVPAETVLKQMNEVAIGDVQPLDTLEALTDWSSVKKYHKLNNEVAIKTARDVNHEHQIVDNIVVTSVAMKSVVS
ncbi:CGI-121-domain-containing protein [Pluteus cervinus]|uniref:CGI-121-domain-containing protein n=1 Tax=Pluteus cervinus TaxID=181527 RepID=A0ACD3AGJ5_9AGAR|nr:CGI-121-domain-containing protein [Pluteus cervinus]